MIKIRHKETRETLLFLVYTSLEGASLKNARLDFADLAAANLQRTNLTHARLQGACLRGADLRSARLERAWLVGADLSGTLLDGATLHGARLYGANLEGASLSNAVLANARYDARTRWPTGFDPLLHGAFPVEQTPSDEAEDLLVAPTDPRSPTERLRAYWLSSGTEIGGGASPEEIAAFEGRYGVRLPPDLRDFVLTINGLKEGEWDEQMIEWYPLHKWQTLPEAGYTVPSLPEAESYFVFADYCLHGWIYAMRLASDATTPNVVIYSDLDVVPLTDSFSELVEAYLMDSDVMLG